MNNFVDSRHSVAGKLKEIGQRLLTTHTVTHAYTSFLCQSCIHTLLCDYGLSTGPTEGLSSWWPRNRSSPIAKNNMFIMR